MTVTSPRSFVRLILAGTCSSLGIRVASVGLTFMVHLLLARGMSAEQYGTYCYVIALMPTLAMVAKLGIPTAAVRFVPQYVAIDDVPRLKGFLRFAFRTVVASCLAIGAIGAGGLYFLRDIVSHDLLVCFSWAVCFAPVFAILQLLQDVARSFKQIVLSQFFEQLVLPLVLLATVVAAYFSGWGLSSTTILNVHLALLLFSVAALVPLVRFLMPGRVRQTEPVWETNTWIRVALPLGVCSAVSALLARMDMLFIGAMLGSESLALYAIPAKVAGLLAFGLAAILAVTSPWIAESFGRQDRASLQRLCSTTTRWAVLGTVPIAIIMVIFSSQILSLFGSEYVSSRPILLLLIVAQGFNVSVGVVEGLLAMTGHHRQYLRVMCSVVALNLVILPLGIHFGGLLGAALVSCGSMLVWKVSLARVAYKELEVDVSILAFYRSQ